MKVEDYVLSYNKLIAEFMEVVPKLSDIYYLPEFGNYLYSYGNIEYVDCFRANSLQYHSSWNWIMPVWKKISMLEKLDEYCNESVFHSEFVEDFINVDIENLFLHIVEFIKWYNKNDKR